MIRVNASLFEDSYNRMIVKGTYLTIVPRFWNVNVPGYEHAVTTTACRAGYMTYSKDPVIFDKGVTGVINDAFFPESLFGELDEVDLFAMKSVCFVNNKLLMSQENDTDGDLCCLRYNIKLPLHFSMGMCYCVLMLMYGDQNLLVKLVMKEMQFDFTMKPLETLQYG